MGSCRPVLGLCSKDEELKPRRCWFGEGTVFLTLATVLMFGRGPILLASAATLSQGFHSPNWFPCPCVRATPLHRPISEAPRVHRAM